MALVYLSDEYPIWSEASYESTAVKTVLSGQQAGALENTFIFSIPVFENMPAAASPYPFKSLDVTVEPPQGYTDTTVWMPARIKAG